MSYYIDQYKLGQSQTYYLENVAEELRIDLQLKESKKIKFGTVYGYITDIEGNPIEDATVKIMDSNFNPLYHGVTNEEGQYSISNLEPNKQYQVFAGKNLFTLNKGIPFVVHPNQSIRRNFVLQDALNINSCIITGEVLDANENTIAGALVELYDLVDPSNPHLIKITHTNSYGQYSFFNVLEGSYMVEAAKVGYKTDEVNFIVDELNVIRNFILTLDEDPIAHKGTINGIIIDEENNPIENAYVILFSVSVVGGKEVLTPIKKTTTNDEGLYLFQEVDYGRYKIKANKSIIEE